MGTALSLCGLNELAISEYEKALEMDPHFPFIHSDIGLSQVFLGRFDEGVRSLERATELSGRSLSVFRIWGSRPRRPVEARMLRKS